MLAAGDLLDLSPIESRVAPAVLYSFAVTTAPHGVRCVEACSSLTCDLLTLETSNMRCSYACEASGGIHRYFLACSWRLRQRRSGQCISGIRYRLHGRVVGV